MAQIGEDSETGSVGRDTEPDRIGGIVRNRKGTNGKVAQGEVGAILKNLPFRMIQSAVLKGPGGERVAIDGHGMATEKNFERAGVVAMFVGQEDSRERLHSHPAGLEARFQLAGTEAGIDEEGRLPAPNERGIAGAATAEGDHFEHAGSVGDPGTG